MDNNSVTAKFKVETKGSDMYNLNDIIVSDSHIVKHGESWVPVSNHPQYEERHVRGSHTMHSRGTSSDTLTISRQCDAVPF